MMAKRRASDKVRAEGRTDGLGSPGVGSGRVGRRIAHAVGRGTGKSVVQLQAEALAEKMFADMMAGAGLSARRMAHEVMYWIPKDFRDQYVALTTGALANTDGGTEARNKAGEMAGAVGRAKGSTVGGGGRKYKQYWTVADEDLLKFKEKVDKRLRGIGREIADLLAEKEFLGELEGGAWLHEEALMPDGVLRAHQAEQEKARRARRRGKKTLLRCECGVIISGEWKFCAHCGREVAANRS